jgi:5-methyltetrahydropteroyltriglutamate--homocysteine methyltransferase
VIEAFADIMNGELHNLADAGCQVIQIEEPLIHQVAAAPRGSLNADFYLKAFNREIAGLRAKTEVWVHTCFGNPAAQKVDFSTDYPAAMPYLDRIDADVITFETASDDGATLEAIGKGISPDKRICIGVVSHRTLQVETAEQVAAFIRKATRYIDPARLIVGTDCGFGRQGMSRLHAFHKMVSIVRGANIVKRELGLPESPCLAADPRYALS